MTNLFYMIFIEPIPNLIAENSLITSVNGALVAACVSQMWRPSHRKMHLPRHAPTCSVGGRISDCRCWKFFWLSFVCDTHVDIDGHF